MSALINRIKDALGTDEDDFALIEVARNAHRAEQKLAAFIIKLTTVENESEVLTAIEELCK